MEHALIPYVSAELRPFLAVFVERLQLETEKRYEYFRYYLQDRDATKRGCGDGRSAKRVSVHYEVKWEYIRTLQKNFMWTDRARLYDILSAQEGENILLRKSAKELTVEERYNSEIDNVVDSFKMLVAVSKRWISEQERITDPKLIDVDKLVKLMGAYERLVKNHIPHGQDSPLGQSKQKKKDAGGNQFNILIKKLISNVSLLNTVGLTAAQVKRMSADQLMNVDMADVESAAELMLSDGTEGEEEEDDGDRSVH